MKPLLVTLDPHSMDAIPPSAAWAAKVAHVGGARRSNHWIVVALFAASVVASGVGCGSEPDRSSAPETRSFAPVTDLPLNFVILMADDLGARELPSYGHPTHVTPNLDRLAEEGIRFRTAFATPICSASRVMIMTGRYAFRTGWFDQQGTPHSPLPDSPAYDIGSHETTFADILRQHGYATALAGKWQLPGSPENRIRDCGFDDYCIWMWKHELSEGASPGERPRKDRWDRTNRFWNPSVIENATHRPTQKNDYGPDIYSRFIVEFIERNRDRPFVAYYPMTLTHRPWAPTPDPGAPNLRGESGLAANVAYMDEIVGRVVRAVDDLGLRDRTVILFTADNATADDGKGEATARGVHVPMIVRAPGITSSGRVSDALVDLSDVLPTLVELAGVQLPDELAIDGKSFAPVLRGEQEQVRDWIFSYRGDERVLRDRRWLLEGNSPRDFGRLSDCGEPAGSSEPAECRPVEDLEEPAAAAARRRLAGILAGLPGPEEFPDLIRP